MVAMYFTSFFLKILQITMRDLPTTLKRKEFISIIEDEKSRKDTFCRL